MNYKRIVIILILLTSFLSISVLAQAIQIETDVKEKNYNLFDCVTSGNVEFAKLKPSYVGIASYTPAKPFVKYFLDMAKYEDETFVPVQMKNGLGVGQDSDYLNTFLNGVIEWNLSRFMRENHLKPDDIKILNLGIRFKVTDHEKPGTEDYFDGDNILLDIYDMENRPSNRFKKDHGGHNDCDETLYEDACEEESNRNGRYYTIRRESLKKGSGYKPSSNTYYYLSEQASKDLQKNLEKGWFAIGLCDRERIEKTWKPPTPPFSFIFDYYLDRGIVIDPQNILLQIVYINKKVNGYTNPPAAYMDKIEPTIIIKDSEASIEGHGWDPDGGHISEYKWTLNGAFLSNKKSFRTSLPVGRNQLMSLKVKDSAGQWSPAVSSLVSVVGCDVTITHPKVGYLYLFDRELIPNVQASNSIVIGGASIDAEASTSSEGISEMTLFIDGEEKITVKDQSYLQWRGSLSNGDHVVKVKIKDDLGRTASDSIIISSY